MLVWKSIVQKWDLFMKVSWTIFDVNGNFISKIRLNGHKFHFLKKHKTCYSDRKEWIMPTLSFILFCKQSNTDLSTPYRTDLWKKTVTFLVLFRVNLTRSVQVYKVTYQSKCLIAACKQKKTSTFEVKPGLTRTFKANVPKP